MWVDVIDDVGGQTVVPVELVAEKAARRVVRVERMDRNAEEQHGQRRNHQASDRSRIVHGCLTCGPGRR